MQIRKLDRQEHGKTRKLYETVFSEDSKEFVDYYYEWKTRDNLIFVAEDENGIHAMLHLNPFEVYVEGKIEKLHYIVAVATQKEYRHQGLMRRLLAAAEQEMAVNGELFTFLMPATEKIYSPFGYRYFAEQKQAILREAGIVAEVSDTEPHENNAPKRELYEVKRTFDATDRESDTGKNAVYAAEISKRSVYHCRPVKPTELQQLADLVNQILREQYDIFVWRDSSYYERLCAEQTCQNGDVMVIVCSDEDGEEQLVGSFCTSCEEQLVGNSCMPCKTDKEQLVGNPCTSFETEIVTANPKCQPDGDKMEQAAECVHVRELILEPDHWEQGMEAVLAFCRAYGVIKIEGFNLAMEEADSYEEWKCVTARQEQAAYQSVPLLMGKTPAKPVQSMECAEQRSERVFDLAAKRIFINEVV